MDLKVSNKACENLINSVSKLEIKVFDNPEQERVSPTLTKRCRYNNKGYCKYRNKCRFEHTTKVCEVFLKDGKCEDKRNCNNRHPKQCKYWTTDKERCHGGENCKYLHSESLPVNGKAIDPNKDDDGDRKLS